MTKGQSTAVKSFKDRGSTVLVGSSPAPDPNYRYVGIRIDRAAGFCGPRSRRKHDRLRHHHTQWLKLAGARRGPAPRIIRHFGPGSSLVGPGCCCKRSRCIFVQLNDGNTSTADVSSEREREFTFARPICYRQSVCRLSVVCNVRAPYSAG